MSLNQVTDVCRVLVSRILALVLSLQYTENVYPSLCSTRKSRVVE